jgi:hypothetical protein
MFTVTGTIDGVGYRVGIHPDGVDDPDAVGVTMGSSNALNLISLHEGLEVQASPTSSPVTVDPKNASTVLALLHSETTVTSIEGDTAPVADVLPLYGPDVVY